MAPTEEAALDLRRLVVELQSYGVRVEDSIEGRRGGAGPSDAGMIRVGGVQVTIPFSADYVSGSPFVLRPDDGDAEAGTPPTGSWGIYRDGRRVAGAEVPHRPRFYDRSTADGIPHWKIALLHLDSLASTVIQTCIYWGKDDQCQFCGIELSLEAGRTIPVKRPEQLAEVALAAKELDGAVDVTLTSGTTGGADKGARYLGRCARAIKASSGLPVQGQFEPPDDLSVLEEIKELGIDSVGMHVESFDPAVLARVAPAKARTGLDGYFRAWRRAVAVFGAGQVSTYVILGMGEDVALTVEGCKRAIDEGVYPFVVPLRPVPGSILGDEVPPTVEYMESVYRQIVPYLAAHGLAAWEVHAGCARCGACSAMAAYERLEAAGATGRRTLPILSAR